MKSIGCITTILVLAYCNSPVGGEENTQVKLPSRDNFHLFLLAGQSNMAGRGKISAEDKNIHPRVFMLSKDGRWKPAVDPIHYDKKVAGVGLGKSFAISLAQINKDISIGLVPAACGGSPISSWEPEGFHEQTNSHPYDDAIRRMRHAMNNGVIKGILWHQGESDCAPERAPEYKQKLRRLIDRFRKDLNATSMPFIIGQLGRFPERPWNDQRQLVNEAHVSLSKEMPLVGFASSDGLSCKQDNVHFDAASLRRFGQRYANVYLEITKQGAAADAGLQPQEDRPSEISSSTRPAIPQIVGDYVLIYKPQPDIYTGKDTKHYKAGQTYTNWQPNDHTFLKGPDNCWHCFGIARPKYDVS